jgi:outer membrane protein assembly factor BamE
MQSTTLAARSTLLLAICLLAVSACVYEMPIQQGNYLDATAMVQVKKGMTRAQVRYLLGTPMVPGGFDNDRWDYDYYLKLRQLKAPRRARASVYFRNDLVDHVDSDVMPVTADVAAAAPANAPVSPPGDVPVVAPESGPSSAPATPPIDAPPSPATGAPADPAAPAPPDAPEGPPSS